MRRLLHHKQAYYFPVLSSRKMGSMSSDNRNGHRSSQTMAKILSVSLCRLTQGLMGPAGNVWAQKEPSPRKRVAPQSLHTSWETPMPLVSLRELSCRSHGFNLLSESIPALTFSMDLQSVHVHSRLY